MFDQNGMNNGFGGFGAQQQNMYFNPTPMMNQQPTKIPNTLTADEIKELQANTNVFNLGLTERESNQARCNHRSLDGLHDSLIYDSATGKARCTICGYEFTPIDPDTSYEDIKAACDGINNILQTTKLLWPDMAVNAAREFYQIIALNAKVPELFGFAAKNFNRHEFDVWNQQNTPGGMQMLQNLGNILGANQAMYFGGMQNGYMGQPQQPNMNMAQPMGAPMGSVAQPVNPGFMNQPVAPMGQPMANPFGYNGASQQVPNQGYAYTPQPNTTPVQPTVSAPAAPITTTKDKETTTVTQKVTV